MDINNLNGIAFSNYETEKIFFYFIETPGVLEEVRNLDETSLWQYLEERLVEKGLDEPFKSFVYDSLNRVEFREIASVLKGDEQLQGQLF